jgi:hypothetical protein
MFRRLRSFLVGFCLLALCAQPAMASALTEVTSITGSAVVMRGNKVEKLYLGARIQKGDRLIVAAGGRVTLTSGTVIGPGTSAVARGRSGTIQVTTTSTKSAFAPKPLSSKLFSDTRVYEIYKIYENYKNDKNSKNSKNDKINNTYEDEEDEKEDEKEDDKYGDPKDPDAVSY